MCRPRPPRPSSHPPVPAQPRLAALASPQAQDSFFPDYAWDHYIVCDATPGNAAKHLGWRFTRKPTATGFGPASFAAIIVRAEDSEEATTLSRSAIEPTGVAQPVTAGGGLADSEEAARERQLLAGIDAPSWLVTMAAAVTAQRVRSSR